MTVRSGTTGEVLKGRYRLDERIASGGMGSVWRARDLLLDRSVAVKVLHEGLTGDPVASARFRREALTAAQISHPRMANVFDYVEDEGRAGIVMELFEGETLGQRIAREGPLPVSEAVRVADAVLAALGAAHIAGIVHRDIKPANILIGLNGEVKVTDFGIARAAADVTLTQTGTVMGTPHYAAPEQISGKPAAPSGDLYALGVVLYEMLTGRRPFEGDTPVAVATARLSEDPTPPRMLRPAIPEALQGVVMRALQRDPVDRYPSAASMRQTLKGAAEAAAEGTQVLEVADPDLATIAMTSGPVRPAPPPRRRRLHPFPRWAGRRLAVLAVLLLAIAAGAAGIAALIGPGTVAVPRFEGKQVAAARAIAEREGLVLDVGSKHSFEPQGEVLRQSVPQGREVEVGSTVAITVSDGVWPCCEVPDVVGTTAERAVLDLEEAGLDLAPLKYVASFDQPAGIVVDQRPAARETVLPGTDATIVVTATPRDEDNGKGHGNGKGPKREEDRD